MKRFCHSLVIVLLFLAKVALAQHQNDNWFLGNNGTGLNFANGSPTLIPPGTISQTSSLWLASYSDPETGKLLLYTDGSKVHNKNNQVMQNGDSLTDNSWYFYNPLIVPYPGHPKLFYIFERDSLLNLLYSVVDLEMNNGLGVVVQKRQILSGELFNGLFIVVSQLHGQGWWLIAHKANSDTFYSFRINNTNIDTIPVKSSAGYKYTFDRSQWYSGHIVSSNDGESFFYSELFGKTVPNGRTHISAGLFSFDKRCGTISQTVDFVQDINLDTAEAVTAAFSKNNKVLYILWYTYGVSTPVLRNVTLTQYDLTQNDPTSSRYIVSKLQNLSMKMYYGPDSKIYLFAPIAYFYGKEYSSKISVINDPDTLGAGCNLQYEAYSLDTTGFNSFYDCPMIYDQTLVNPKKGYAFPEIVKKDPCLFNNTLLYIKDGLIADSINWELGDGSISHADNVAHDYAHVGTYPLTLRWYVCGREYELKDSISIHEKIDVNLSKDTTVCKGTAHTFYANDTLDEYRWSSGDSTYHSTVTKAGMYTLDVRRGLCWKKDSTWLNNYPDINTKLEDEYFICDNAKEVLKLDAGPGFQAYWWNSTGDSTQAIDVTNLGEYVVTVKDQYGCVGPDSTKVKRSCPATVYYPNAFTPNGDGINDNYKPVGNEIVSFSLKIYNRWGGMIFESNDINNTWDGKVKGNPAASDTYFYTSTYSGYIQKQIRHFETSGNLALIR